MNAEPQIKTKFVPGVDTFDKHEEQIDYEFRKKLKKSNFLITINSNRARFTEAYENKFKLFHKYIFAGRKILKYLKCKHCLKGACVSEESGDQTARCVRDINIVVKYELSPPSAGRNANQLHSHVLCEVVHTGSVQIDMAKIKKLAYRFFGYKVYISVRGSPDIGYSRRQYLLNQSS